jgi:MerR family transcriptional regulator, copper efflux regulator
MLRYRESLGLLPPVRPGRRGHRQFTERDMETVAAAFALERRFDIGPVALAFGLRVLTEPAVRAALADLGERTGRLGRARALDFEQERALRLLGGAPRRAAARPASYRPEGTQDATAPRRTMLTPPTTA